MEEKIKKALDKVRPSMQADGGDVEFIKWDEKNGQVQVRLMGMCVGCPMAQITLKQGIEAEVKKAVPEVKEVAAV
ncbi:NifU family protein [Candidatus Parcubacteria bacterium]|nr:NifU family protein [Candidatus Parcubacteria bacterium]